ncbi:MAG TPA: nuclear transport factor 2 family protein [Pyrinomonadaceae bacterium]
MNSDSAMNSNDFGDSRTVEILRGIQQRLANAWVEGDRAFIEQTLADDWSVTDLSGRVMTKAEVLEEGFGSNARRVVSARITDIRVRAFGDWAIVTGRTEAAGEYRGKTMEVALRFTDVFALRDGRWQALVSQATLLQ